MTTTLYTYNSDKEERRLLTNRYLVGDVMKTGRITNGKIYNFLYLIYHVKLAKLARSVLTKKLKTKN